ncbi:hypothetical protein EV191_106180 [Tamaricihabitans halophyticus]|uniref:Uncharacterized protein n=1 Tax=Tamaricihabitans halophyticus TaxID=1262583 RepID=A0A4V2STU8_9PSEU|nr:hypothetical protein [Tamaricihabitans halophyticus]TCP52016.1 hypothetical protein EV191_106180 [Tamaricihabitans halophyticus]
MFRVLEIIGVLAPIVGIVVLLIYRRRAMTGVVWGIAGALMAAIASLVGFAGPRLSLFSGGTSSGEQLLRNMESWAMIRLGLLVISVGLLVVGALSGRRGEPAPTGWLALGIPLAIVGSALAFVHFDFGPDSEGATEIVGILVEIAEFALLGLGVLVLCVAVVSGRGQQDGRTEPGTALVNTAMRAKRLYDQYHARDRR